MISRILFIILLMISINYSYANQSLSGKIIDSKNGQPLSGVSIYFPDLKTGTISNQEGLYKIDHLPSSKVLIQISLIGYKLITEQIDLATTTSKNFSMDEAVTELNEIVITGLSKSAERKRSPIPITVMSSTQLQQQSATNIIDAIATLPGITQVSTGVGISKPVIRGLGYNRVLVVNNGIRQEGQQWGDEHGIEIDEYSVNRIEILKGPASLSYGSDALAGVIHFLPSTPVPEGKIKGNVLMNYQTNNGLLGGSFDIAGNNKGFIWDMRYSQKLAHAYKNKYDGYVFNSGFAEKNFDGMLGINRSWGYSHLDFSTYNQTPGIVEGERDEQTGAFLKPVKINATTSDEVIADKKDFLSYSAFTPYQKIKHNAVVSNSSFILKNGTLKTVLGWQQNQRKEFDDVLNFNQYGLAFNLNTLNYDVRYIFPDMNHYSISIGANGMYQKSINKGTEYLIPDYNLTDIGAFITAKKTINKLDISGGFRYDTRNEKANALWLNQDGEKAQNEDVETFEKFKAFDKNFGSFSSSLGFSYQLPNNMFTKLNIAKGYRAPNIAELASNGIHEGSLNYIKGSSSLLPENSFQVDYSFGINSLHITAEANLFYNYIKNFIFLQNITNLDGSDFLTDGYRTFQYTSGNVNRYGGEISIDIHPHPYDWLHLENSFSYVLSLQQNQSDSTRYIPQTPAPKYVSELKLDKKKIGKAITNSFFKIELENYFKQNKIYSAYNTETATPGYSLLNIGAGADIVSKSRTLFSLYFNINNMTNKAYQNHLSRLKYAPENLATGRTGVYNMGRNLSLKVIVPINFKS